VYRNEDRIPISKQIDKKMMPRDQYNPFNILTGIQSVNHCFLSWKRTFAGPSWHHQNQSCTIIDKDSETLNHETRLYMGVPYIPDTHVLFKKIRKVCAAWSDLAN